MTNPESVEAAPSADNGNLPVDAPNQQNDSPDGKPDASTAKPAEGTETVLYELPDGRKVDAETLSKEWKDNFLPDYTRKSQALAAKEKGGDATITKPAEKDPYEDPNYVPKNYKELIDAAKSAAIRDFKQEQTREAEERTALENKVTDEVTALKKADPALDENKLFQHAVKYGFRDLNAAYQNMKDMNLVAKNSQQTTVKNIARRADPVSTGQGKSNGGKSDPTNFGSARDYLRSLK